MMVVLEYNCETISLKWLFLFTLLVSASSMFGLVVGLCAFVSLFVSFHSQLLFEGIFRVCVLALLLHF